MGTFWIGCVVTLYHGIDHIIHPPAAIESVGLSVGVLAASFLVDGYVLVGVLRSLYKAKPKDVPFITYLRSLNDPFVVSVLLEDLTACAGVLVAGAGITAASMTGNMQWDGIASCGVGGLLGLFALTLVRMNRAFLIGKSIDADTENAIQKIIRSRKSIEAVYAVQSQWVGPSAFSYKAEIDFNGHYFAKQLQDLGYNDPFLKIESPQQLTKLLSWYTDDVITLVEREIDDIEHEIRSVYPQAVYIDLELSSTLSSMKVLELILKEKR
eukprot:GEZU01023199.1.p1 GENE.GEZU01023199.1~~GEZU01023199.1.p1  ORF type:complete len:268 (+),score=44.70 GEZU01023199.1:99-902(+)